MSAGGGPWGRRGVPLGPRMIAFDRLRFAVTTAGIGCAVLLMLFLVALHDGVREESNGYIASRPVHAWVMQDNTTNFIKSSSFVRIAGAATLAAVDGVVEVTPLVRLITTLEFRGERVQVIVLGVDPESPAGPPEAAEGSAAARHGEIVLDRALARRHGLRVGDRVAVQGRPFRVVGLSRGTNSVLTQFVFIELADARELLGVSQLASFLLVRGAPGIPPDRLAARLAGRVPRTSVLTRDAFAANNLGELQDGLLPILATVATLGGIVALAVLTLLLYGAILEQRETWAVLKAIGAPDRVLARVIVFQSLTAVGGGLAFGLLAYAACAPLAVYLVPVLALSLAVADALAVAAAVTTLGLIGALLPLRRVRRIHPAELFRA